jgi:hypothetical protein
LLFDALHDSAAQKCGKNVHVTSDRIAMVGESGV